MRQHRWRGTYVGVLSFGMLVATTRADIVYVEASIANTVGAASGAQDWFSGDDGSTGGFPTTGGSITDDLWRFRTGQGSGEGIWEATSSGTQPEDAVLIKTSITDAPVGTYDVYVFYRSQGDPDNWKIRAGLTDSTLGLYDRSGADGIAGERVFSGGSSTLDFVIGTEPTEDTGQPLYYAVIGQATVTDGLLEVYVDDFPTSALIEDFLLHRTWYDGIGYFTDVAPTFVESVMSGLHTAGSTWDNNQPASAGNNYRVVDSHTVTINSPFLGDRLHVGTGGTVDFSASASDIRILVVEEGGNITESVSGNFYLGDIAAPELGTLELNSDVSFTIDAGADFGLDMTLQGEGDIDFQSGPGSRLILTNAAGHQGIIRFNGQGDEVRLTEVTSSGVGTLEMNSTGANRVYYNPGAQADAGTIIFNQPGTLDHAASQTSPLRRLHGASVLVANADVTVDLSRGFPSDSSQSEERRLLIGSTLDGSGNLNILGTATDYSFAAISHNEFEVGSTGEPTSADTDPYSGTMTASDYVDLEIRHNLPNATFVINQNARLEMGHQAIASAHSMHFGSVTINSGGTLEVGFEQTSAGGVAGHHAYTLTLTDDGSRDGTLTLAGGATTRMQINGTGEGEFDRILAHGDVQLGGTLEVLVNPPASSGDNPLWTPTIGDTVDIIEIVAAPPVGDYDGSGTVDQLDYDTWSANFGTDDDAADGNSDGIVNAADYVLWRNNVDATGATDAEIMGTFLVDVVDFNGAFFGFDFQVNYSPTLVQLEVIASGSATGIVPEPSSLLLLMGLLPVVTCWRRRRS